MKPTPEIISPAAKLSAPAQPKMPAPRGWVPIRPLGVRHRGRILSHLLQLSADDRYLRFGYIASDEQIERYVDGLDFDRDAIYGIFNRRLELIAWAHLAFAPIGPAASAKPTAEFGVSVLERARGRGFGARLFEHASLLARNRGIHTLVIQALSENAAMLRLARNAGATVERDGSESEARLTLPPESLSSRLDELVGNGAAEIDYRFKVQTRRLDAWLNAVEQARREWRRWSAPD